MVTGRFLTSVLVVLLSGILLALFSPTLHSEAFEERSENKTLLEQVIERIGGYIGIVDARRNEPCLDDSDTTQTIVSLEVDKSKIKIDGEFSPGEYDPILGRGEGHGWSADIEGEDQGSVYSVLTRIERSGGDEGRASPYPGNYTGYPQFFFFNLMHNIVRLIERHPADYNKFIFSFPHTPDKLELTIWLFRDGDYTGGDELTLWLDNSGILEIPQYSSNTSFDDRGFLYALTDEQGNYLAVVHHTPEMPNPNQDPKYWTKYCVYGKALFTDSAFKLYQGQLPGASKNQYNETYEMAVLMPPPLDNPGDFYFVRLDEQDPRDDGDFTLVPYWDGRLGFSFAPRTAASSTILSGDQEEATLDNLVYAIDDQ